MKCPKCQYCCDPVDHGRGGAFWVCGRCHHQEPVTAETQAAFDQAQKMYWSIQCQDYDDSLEELEDDE